MPRLSGLALLAQSLLDGNFETPISESQRHGKQASQEPENREGLNAPPTAVKAKSALRDRLYALALESIPQRRVVAATLMLWPSCRARMPARGALTTADHCRNLFADHTLEPDRRPHLGIARGDCRQLDWSLAGKTRAAGAHGQEQTATTCDQHYSRMRNRKWWQSSQLR
jgi:hypothetical protein